MKQIKNDQFGGWDFKWDDLRWMQTAYIEALAGLGSSVGNCILSGCELQNNNANNTDGFIFYDGEIYQVSGASIATEGTPNTPTVYFKVVEDYDVSGNRTTNLATVIDTYLVRKAKIVVAETGQSGSNYITYVSLKTYNSLLATQLQPEVLNLQNKIHGFTGQNASLVQNNWDLSELYVTRSYEGFVTISGVVDGTNASGTLVAKLPAHYRPITNIIDTIRVNQATSGVEQITINTNGDITIPILGIYYVTLTYYAG
ncbi:MAG: hypothetical protein CL843_16485 [Crocinitomicaceae bacterium]|nr:hypothetical protein [Crocinitomicaceae bacterium]|tara:strand:+ start:760 stop:1530 length:771 start_codon:yes stop_codon:yes gene_type:complete